MSASAYQLFQCYGIEIEYMIVNRTDLNVNPIADQILRDDQGMVVSDLEFGPMAWSNELLAHVIELKTNGPVDSLDGVATMFQENVSAINHRLNSLGCQLMPTGMHPWMDPRKEKKLWEHENRTIYETFDRIFNCTGHGWANLQSMHINLPFQGDDQFAKLHSAIRLVLPLLPTLAASSPIVERDLTGVADNRMEFYRNNSRRIPEIAGRVVPELVLSQKQYDEQILQRIYAATAPFDAAGVLRHEWCNSRGAIARFGRGSIEIRVIDAQECPAMDLTIAELTVVLLKHLVESKAEEIAADTPATSLENLAQLFLQGVRQGGEAEIAIPGYLPLFELDDCPLKASQFWPKVFQRFKHQLSESATRHLAILCEHGNLAQRISAAVGPDLQRLELVYEELCRCLAEGRPFVPGSLE